MAESNKGIFTESFEAVVTDFYNVIDDVAIYDKQVPDLSEHFKYVHDIVSELNSKESAEKSHAKEDVEILPNSPTDVIKSDKPLESKPHIEKSKIVAAISQESQQAAMEKPADLESNTTLEIKKLDLTTDAKVEVIPFLERYSEVDKYSNKLLSETKPSLEPSSNTTVKMNQDEPKILKEKPERMSALEMAFGKLELSPKGQLLKEANSDFCSDTGIETTSKSCNEVVFRTQNTNHFINFEWSLENFSEYLQSVFSAEFSAMGCKKKWQSYIFFKFISSSQLEKMDVFFRRTDEGIDPISVCFDLGIFNSNGDQLGQWDSEVLFTESKRHCCCIQLTRPGGKGSSKSSSLKLINDELIIKGNIKVQGCCIHTKKLEKPILNVGNITINI